MSIIKVVDTREINVIKEITVDEIPEGTTFLANGDQIGKRNLYLKVNKACVVELSNNLNNVLDDVHIPLRFWTYDGELIVGNYEPVNIEIHIIK